MNPAPRRKLWLARHGNRLDYADPDWRRKAARPWAPPLAPDGLFQARRLAQRMALEQIDAIYSSPFLRAAQTGVELAAALGLPLYIEPGLG